MYRSWIGLALVFALGAPLGAQGISSKQKKLMQTRLTVQYGHSYRDDARALQQKQNAYKVKYLLMAEAAARRHGIPRDLFIKLIETESNWDPNARSHKGAVGLTQLMPKTARLLKVDAYDPQQNLDGGARYLARQYKRFKTWRLALAAYNAGPHVVSAYKGVPPFEETQNYLRKIMG